MPKGIITRFIVETHPWIEYVWRSGVVLSKNKTRAEVIENYNQKEIKVRVVGNRKKELLAVVQNELEKINNSFARLTFNIGVPCNCAQCLGSQTPHFYSDENLYNRLEANRYQVECEKSYQMVDVRRLIDDANLPLHQENRESVRSISPWQQELEATKEKNTTIILNISQNQVNKNMNQSPDQSRKIEITGGTINASGAAALSLGDISGTVANTINQLPEGKDGIKELLEQLKTAIESEGSLSAQDKVDALEHLQTLAEAGQKPNEGAVQKTAKITIQALKGIFSSLPDVAKLAEAAKTLIPLIAHFFGL